jgi:endonuclease/exonuclease/phosphatase family metal-dependent hydrolase
MARIIAEQVKGFQNVILAGDFNMNPDTESISLIEQELKSVFSSDLKSSFNMNHKKNPNFASAVVDMIFLSKPITVIEKYVSNVDVSDHLPLFVKIELS